MNTDSAKTDAEVVSLVLSNKDFFVILISRYEEKLTRYMIRLGVSVQEDREDILQSVFIKVYKNLNNYDDSFSFSSWIYRIAHNEAMSFFRARSIRPYGHTIANSEDVFLYIADALDLADEVNKSYDRREIEKALNALDEKYKDIIVLRFFEELDYKEISDILEIPPGSVATLLHRAKKQLHTLLEHIQ